MRRRSLLRAPLAALAVAGLAQGPLGRPAAAQAQPQALAPSLPRLRLIGEQRIAHRAEFQGTPLGGLSGVDYDPASDSWVLLSDDRSELASARLYTARIGLRADALEPPQITSVVTLRRPDGSAFARREVDPEAIRLRPGTGTWLWTSEGDVRQGQPPSLREMRADGSHVREFELPAVLRPEPGGRSGPRDNLTLEGLALSPDGRTAWAAMEAALIEDGEPPAVGRAGGVCRFFQWDVDSGRLLRDIAYRPDAIPQAPSPAGGYADNGVSEILMRDARRLWVLERAFMQGVGNSLRLYEIDVGADPAPGAAYGSADPARPLPKTLLLDFASLGLPRLDNTEAMCWGPQLPARDGQPARRTLLCVSDDNFNRAQITQLLAFEVIE